MRKTLLLFSTFATLIGYATTTTTRPYKADSPWGENLATNIDNAEIDVNNGILVKDNARGLGVVMDTLDTLASVNIRLNLGDQFDKNDLYYAFLSADFDVNGNYLSKTVKASCDSIPYYEDRYYSSDIDSTKSLRWVNYYFTVNAIDYGLTFSSRDTIWLSNFYARIKQGEIFDATNLPIYSNNTSYGTVSYTKSMYYREERPVATATAKSGYYFTGWSDGENSKTHLLCDSIYSVVDTLYANFKAYSGHIVVLDDGNGSAYPSSANIPDSITLRAESYNKCITFSHWSDGNTDNPRVYYGTGGNDTLTAYFNVPEYIFSASSADTSMGIVKKQIVRFDAYNHPTDTTVINGECSVLATDSALNLYAVPNPGYKFVRWSDGSTYTTKNIPIAYERVCSDTTNYNYIAYFAKNDSFKVVVVSSDTTMGTVTGGGYYNEGSVITKKATPKEGYKLSGWKSKNNLSTTYAQGNDTLTAIFTQIQPVVSVYQDEYDYRGDTIKVYNLRTGETSIVGESTLNATFLWGDTIRLTACPRANRKLVMWNDSLTTPTREEVLKRSSYAFGATFGYIDDSLNYINPYLSVAVYNKSVYPGNDTVKAEFSYMGKKYIGTEFDSIVLRLNYADTIRLTACPNVNSVFVRWSDGETSPSRTIVMGKKDVFMEAIFDTTSTEAVDSVSVTVLSSNDSLGTVTGNGWYLWGDSVTISAKAIGNGVFEKWSDGSTRSVRKVACTSDMTFTAIFKKSAPWSDNAVANNSWKEDTMRTTKIYKDVDLSNLMLNATQMKHLTLLASVALMAGNKVSATIECYTDSTCTKKLGTFILHSNSLNVLGGLVLPAPSSNYNTYSETGIIPEGTNYLRLMLESNDASSISELENAVKNEEILLSRKVYDVELMTDSKSMGSVYGSGEYQGGDTATVKAVAAPGYQFVCWSDSTTDALRNVIIEKDLALTAYFSECTGVMTLSAADESLVNVYSVEGYLIRKNVLRKDATNGLKKGFYIVGDKKVYVNR